MNRYDYTVYVQVSVTFGFPYLRRGCVRVTSRFVQLLEFALTFACRV